MGSGRSPIVVTTVYKPTKCWGGYRILNGYLRKGKHAAARVMQSKTDEAYDGGDETADVPIEERDISIIDKNENFVDG